MQYNLKFSNNTADSNKLVVSSQNENVSDISPKVRMKSITSLTLRRIAASRHLITFSLSPSMSTVQPSMRRI